MSVFSCFFSFNRWRVQQVDHPVLLRQAGEEMGKYFVLQENPVKLMKFTSFE
jgi:hypothetical protein